MIDEMQNLDRASLGAICMALHRVSQQDLPVALVGAGLPTLPTMLRAAKPYAPRLFSYHTLGQLSAAEARLALVGPAGLQSVEFKIVNDSLDRGFFGPAFELATDAEQRYLIAIANLGGGPVQDC